MKLISEKQYKANLHCHSALSDGCHTPEELKQAYMEQGYSILAITDHERPHDHSQMTDKNFVMITGYEAYIRSDPNCTYMPYESEIHINLFAKNPHNTDIICYNSPCVKYIKDPQEKINMPKYGSQETRRYDVDYINQFIKTAHEDGYLVCYNHPTWSAEDFARVQQYQGFLSMEMCNYSSYIDGHPEYNGSLYELLLKSGHHIFTHGSDDNHNVIPFGKPGCDSFGAFTMFNLENDVLCYEGVIDAMQKGTFYASMGPKIHLLEINGRQVHVETSDATQISLLYGAKQTKKAFPEELGKTITSADFIVPDDAKYFRIHVRDTQGKFADSRGYFFDELEG